MMKLITFNPLRTIGIPGVKYIKPEHMFKEKETIRQADVVLFPEHWQLGSLIHGLKAKTFPSLSTIQLGINKIEQTRAMQMMFPEVVPYTLILSNTNRHQEQVWEEMPLPFVAKEVKSARGEGVYLIENEADFQRYARKTDILYVQEYLPIDRDMRIVIVGEETVAAYWRMAENGQFHNNLSRGGRISFQDPIPREAIDLVETICRTFSINHAGFDIAQAGSRLYFLEWNTLFGNEALRALGISVEHKIYQYLKKEFEHKPFPTGPSNPLGKIS